ncbi:hypothetical protein ACRAWD_27705 [Caulobacter segnis]
MPVDFATLEQRAAAAMPAFVLNYVQGRMRRRVHPAQQYAGLPSLGHDPAHDGGHHDARPFDRGSSACACPTRCSWPQSG